MRLWFSKSWTNCKHLWQATGWPARVLVGAFSLCLFAASTLVMSYYGSTGNGVAQTYVVRRGTPFSVIVEDLARRDIVSSEWMMKIHGWVKGADARIIAGEYQFAPERSVASILSDMMAGAVVRRRFTAVEGKTSREILELLRRTEGIEGPFPQDVPEASLWPETYFYTWGDSGTALVERMNVAFRQNTQQLWQNRDPDLPLKSLDQALILASIVEKETGVDAERPLVAAVFYNRMRLGMPLQSDATVIYALWRDQGRPLDAQLSRQDLLYDSPFNTYRYRGLPPFAICNPGKASLMAVLHPAKSEALYFVANGTGGHVFADTLLEHQTNHQKWRKIRDKR
ncbi:MAG: endolytic transglycosylase MltG [Holosporales bacterium]